jgi:hypothetical protein
MPLFQLSDEEIKPILEADVSEEKLRGLFERHGLAMIESGLRFADRNVGVRSGFIDTLALDSKRRPVVIEYKTDQADTPSALVQALSYVNGIVEREADFDRLFRSRLTGLTRETEIDFDDPRIVLVAPGFELQVIEAAKQASVTILALEYKVYATGESHTFATTIRYDGETTRRTPGARKASSIEDHFGSGGYKESKPTFERLASEIRRTFRVEPSYRQDYIVFKDTGNLFAWVFAYTRGQITVGINLPAGEHPGFELAPKSWADSYPRITHVAKLRRPKDVSKEVLSGLKRSHDRSL